MQIEGDRAQTQNICEQKNDVGEVAETQGMEVGMSNMQTSLVGYIMAKVEEIHNERLIDKIKRDPATFQMYFNYDINPYTWNLLVNKQIFMKFERLFIEK